MSFQSKIWSALAFCACIAGAAGAVSINEHSGASSNTLRGVTISNDVTAQAGNAFRSTDDLEFAQPVRSIEKHQPTVDKKSADPGISPIALDVYISGFRPGDRHQEVMDNIIIGLSCKDDINAITADGLEYRSMSENPQVKQANAMSPFVLVSMLACLVSVGYFIFKNKFMPRRGFDY